jgi:peptidoglycan/xylan/chitin deacetylase (PgdA/CDA1 family)
VLRRRRQLRGEDLCAAARLSAAAALTACVVACDGAPRSSEALLDSAAAGRTTEEAPPPLPALAVTIDDLPWLGAVRPGETRTEALRTLIDALSERGVPAVGFANCDRAGAGAPLLRLWVDAGLELGNHTAAHLDLNDAPLRRWLSDVRSCHDVVRDINADGRVWFRYPYLHQGPTTERQTAALALLRELGSPIAHVTIDNSDWILAAAYGEAVRDGDSARAAAIGDAFVEHIVRATLHYQNVAREKAGRDVPHVLLLHANLLVAEHVGTLLDRLRTGHAFRFVSVEMAQRDSVYDRPDEYTGAGGLSWLYRMAPATPAMAAWDDAEAQRLRDQWRQRSAVTGDTVTAAGRPPGR